VRDRRATAHRPAPPVLVWRSAVGVNADAEVRAGFDAVVKMD
jgi:hypothetical protein